MRGKTYQFNVNQIAAQIASTSAGAKMKPVDVAARAADIADAVYGETNARNAGDMAAAEGGAPAVTLYTEGEVLKSQEADANPPTDDGE